MDRKRIRAAVEAAAHVLPSQPPIEGFVHHNPLHEFEHLPFDDAVRHAAELYGVEPYRSERWYRDELARGRVSARDLDAVLTAESLSDEPLGEGLPSVRALWECRLHADLPVIAPESLAWFLGETDALEAFVPMADVAARRRIAGDRPPAEVLPDLWRACMRAAIRPELPAPTRHAERLRREGEGDPDPLAHMLLIRLCAAFLDQGAAYWPLPGRDEGLHAAFRALYADGAGPDPWLAELPSLVAAMPADPLESVAESLEVLGVGETQLEAFVRDSLLALRGFAGMIQVLEARPDRAPSPPPASLMEFLAVRLILDRLAVADELRRRGGVSSIRHWWRSPRAPEEGQAETIEALELFRAAQLTGVSAETLADPTAGPAFARAVAELGSIERRRLLQLAYERRHRVETLDALLAHDSSVAPTPEEPIAQMVFCIDEREESLRRHLEEIEPALATYGAAGFYGVGMFYQGLDDPHPHKLAPVPFEPQHLIREVPERSEKALDRRRARRSRVGRVRAQAHVGGSTLARGGLMATLGVAKSVPLVLGTLFPRLHDRAVRQVAQRTIPDGPTRLALTREPSEGRGADGLYHGYTLDEQADVVAGILAPMGLTEAFAPLVVMVGHGSNSLNNPHEAAHDCGACSGGRGGPNARAFAQMANDPEVRRRLEERGVRIGAETHFVGGYHDTCDDSMTFYDTDRIGDSHRSLFERIRSACEEARARDALERCRRFASAPRTQRTKRALRHVEGRAVDLAQPRPEYGHATNAICHVGRRDTTRGLFLDRRAFLVSYDPAADPDGALLEGLLASVGPVGAGINLEYWFSFIDPTGYGCGTKLPHNVTSLLGVMNGHASDLRTGLPWQMVEIHEPVRLLTVVEAEPELLLAIAERQPALGQLIGNGWIQLVSSSPSTGELAHFQGGRFVPHRPERESIPRVQSSAEHFLGLDGVLPCASIGAPALHAGGPS